jgi:hypothetical protein
MSVDCRRNFPTAQPDFAVVRVNMMCLMTDGPQFPFQQQPQQQAPPPWAAEPNWEALAEESQSHARRKKLMVIGGGALAVAVVGGIVATAVVSADKKPGPSPSATAAAPVTSLPPESAFPSVAAPSPENPLDILSSAAKDTAPLNARTLFPAKNLNLAGRAYVRTNTDASSSCSSVAASALSAVLANNGCEQVFRATYLRDDVAVTVGVAVFDSAAKAEKVRGTTQYIRPLDGGGVADFCHAVRCSMTANSAGRYAYFTIAGLKNNQSLSGSGNDALQAGNDVSSVTFQLLVQRGREEANARLAASPAG